VSAITIKHSHSHGSKRCFEIRGGTLEERKPADMPPFSPWYRDGHNAVVDVGLVIIGGNECVVGYRVYTGHWYAWDPKTGEEMASFTRRFYDAHIAPLRPIRMLPDPDCVVATK